MAGLRIRQINLHHSSAASASLLMTLEEDKVDIALIQEPWISGGGRIQGLGGCNYNLFHSREEGKIRSAILAKNNLNILFETNYSTKDLAVILCTDRKDRRKSILIASSYMAYEEVVPPPEVVCLVNEACRRKAALIIGADTNAHHQLWGCRDTNKRGEFLLNFIHTSRLLIANEGSEPTYVGPNSDSVIDMTLFDGAVISKWKVSETASLSDHRYIDFSILINPARKSKPFKNPKRTDWEKYREFLSINPPLEFDLNTVTELETRVVELTNWMTSAFNKACPLSRPRKKQQPPWWNSNLRELRDTTKKLFAVWKQNRDANKYDEYKNSLRNFKREQRKAVRNSWRSFCNNIENSNETARLRRILSKTKEVPSQIQKSDGKWTENGTEILTLMLDTHFPISKVNQISFIEEGNTLDAKVVTEAKVKWAIISFEPYKSPGPDGIFPALLQQAGPIAINLLKDIFRACLLLEHVPINWRTAKVVFIPKAGKIQHSSPKDYRPISLTSFLLKSLERILEIHIRDNLNDTLVAETQHAYTKGKSTDSALHSVVRTIERSMESKQYTLATFVDIEGAFNNVHTEAIIDALKRHKINTKIIKWIYNHLAFRMIKAEWNDETMVRKATRGTPQGGVLSPLLWLLVVDEILIQLPYTGIKAVAYADDIVILASGIDLNTLSDNTTSALNRMRKWAEQKGLGVNPSKTEIVLFTKKYKIPSFDPPKIGDTALQIGKKAKYLGLTLDSKLLWRENIIERTRKANCALYACKKMLGTRWGLTPRLAYWTYTAIVRPILTYGALVWWHSLEKRTYREHIEKVQRTACISVTGALRSTPTEALFAMLNLPHLNLYSKNVAWKSAIRLSNGCFETRPYGHSRIIWNRDIQTDYIIPIRKFDRNFKVVIPERSYWTGGENSPDTIYVYTDGSKMGNNVGAGVFCGKLELEKTFKLPDASTVFQAEILAILKSANLLEQKEISGKRIRICVDSQAALKALNNFIKSKLVLRCYESITKLAESNTVELYWVPAHKDIPGNEKADELAKKGAHLDQQMQESILPPLQNLYNFGNESLLANSNRKWISTAGCLVSKKTWPSFNQRRTKQLISQTKTECRSMVRILTGHCLLQGHLHKIGLSDTSKCTYCEENSSIETAEHILCHCPTLSWRRYSCLGWFYLEDLTEMADLPISGIRNLIKALRPEATRSTLE